MRVINIKSDRALAGFTLVELMITLAISGIIVATIYSAYIAQQRTYLAQEQVAEMQQNIRAGMMIMTGDIRMAGYDASKTGNYGMTSATSGKFVFTADLNDDGGTPGTGETLTYELYTPGGAGITALRRIAGQAPVAENIQAVEFCYDTVTTLASSPPTCTTAPTDLNEIRSVQISTLARAGKPDRKFINGMTYTSASGGVMWAPAPGVDDNFRRRLMITTVNCRNMGL